MTATLPATERLYRTDSYATELEATVLSAEPGPAGLEVVLDRTIFYPTSGGQQHDTGSLAGRRVVDVTNSEDGERVVHHLTGADRLEPGARVPLRLDWARRFDFMQQHTGEHILGQAFYRLGFGVSAVAMGEELCTLDLGASLGDAEALEAETLANEAVWAAHPVSVFEVPEGEAARFPLRRPPQVSGTIRVVQIGDFDSSACGGTHLRSSAEVGLVKVLKTERVKGGATRVTFICGRRALHDYRFKHDFVSRLARGFSTSLENVPARTDAALEELAASRRDVAALRSRLAEATAAGLLAGSPDRVVVRELEDASLLPELAKTFAALPGAVAVLGARTDRAMLAVAAGPGASADAGAILKLGLPHVEGRGGGKPDLAQGSGPKLEGLPAALEAMRAGLPR